jgi:hypothetical protein
LLAAMAIIAIALVAMMAALQHGLSGIETGRGESVAVFLVEHKLEELMALARVDWAASALQPGTTIEYCQPSGAACAPTRTTPALRRVTVVAAGRGGTCAAQCRVVTVSVFYRPLTGLGYLDRERRVDVGAMFVAHA